MKLRYLYRQMLAFWIVILVVFLIVGVSFKQFTKRSMLTSTFSQLSSYADATRSIANNEDGTFINDLPTQERLTLSASIAEKVLSKENIHTYIFDGDGDLQYAPQSATKKPNIEASEWKKLRAGYTIHDTKADNMFREKGKTAYLMKPLFQNRQFVGAIVLTQPLSHINSSLELLTENMLRAFLISSVVAIVISYFLAKMQVNRINRMRKATEQIAEGNFDIHLEVDDKDELDDLAADFNSMAGALQSSNEEVERQEERRKQFMADAAHEMRTPLTTINGLLEGLQYNAIPEDQKEKCISLMQNETSRLIRLVNENLDYEKIRTNQISIVVKKFDATQTLRNLLNQLESKAEAAHDQLILEAPGPIDIYADYDRFMQIMVNIIQNAIQFTSDGKITVSVAKGYLETIIKIQDTGIGMTEDEVQNIWDRYYKADPSRKNTKYGESGLGLSIVHQLIRLHKGKIDVESVKDQGTTFTITFPDIEITDQE